MPVHLDKEALIAKVEAGDLTPDEAEAEAARLGIGPLQARPDPADYDPMREPYWTLPMAAAWIAYRTVDAVRESWPYYRERCRHWLYQDKWRHAGASGFRLVPWRPPSLMLLRLAEHLDDRTDRDPDFSRPVSVAIEELVSGLRASCFEASGIASSSGRREEIPNIAWRELVIIESDGDLVRPRTGSGTSYRDVVVPTRSVRGLWSVRRPEPEPLTLPPLMRPEGGGYMPLYCAAQWIATEGGAIDFDPLDTDRWRHAYDRLLARLASEEVKAIGFRNGRNEPLPGYRFAGIEVAYPFVDTPIDLIMSDALHLQSYAYTDEQHWRDGYDDSLEQHRGEKWSRVMVLKADVAAIWPFGATTGRDISDASQYRSGAPGRPTSSHLVAVEFDRRAAAGLVEPSLSKEAAALAAWLKSSHPSAPPMTEKTIRERIRAAYRRLSLPENKISG